MHLFCCTFREATEPLGEASHEAGLGSRNPVIAILAFIRVHASLCLQVWYLNDRQGSQSGDRAVLVIVGHDALIVVDVRMMLTNAKVNFAGTSQLAMCLSRRINASNASPPLGLVVT